VTFLTVHAHLISICSPPPAHSALQPIKLQSKLFERSCRLFGEFNSIQDGHDKLAEVLHDLPSLLYKYSMLLTGVFFEIEGRSLMLSVYGCCYLETLLHMHLNYHSRPHPKLPYHLSALDPRHD
jgi:hypothetical protein